MTAPIERPLSVAFFMQDFAGGGVERMRLRLAHALAVRGVWVTMVVVSAHGPLRAELSSRVALMDLQRSRTWTALPGLRRFLRHAAPDFLISSLDHNNIAALLAHIATPSRTRVIICQHNALSRETALGWRYRLMPLLYRLLHRRAAAIVAVSDGVAHDLARAAGIPRAAITTIHNPVVDPTLLPAPSDPPPHPWLADKTVPVFVFVGRLVPQKDPLMLVRALALRLAAGPARLLVLGEGPLGNAMIPAAEQAGIAQHMAWIGYVADPLRWIVHAHALVLPSRYEGFGNVIVEALACGTPVVATDCPHGPREILEGGKYGRLTAVGDAAAFAHAMSGDLRAAFPADNLRQAASAYTVAHAADRHLALFQACLQRSFSRRAFGLRFSRQTASAIADRLITEAASLRGGLVITPNLDHIRHLRQPDFFAAASSAAIVCADGWPVAFYAALKGAAPFRRVTGCDILHALAIHPGRSSPRIVIVTECCATTGVLEQWLHARGLARCWSVETAPPGLGADAEAQARLARAIAAAHPHVLILTLGAPVSEVFVHRYQDVLGRCWALCVGQAVRVELGLTQRAPAWLRAAGLEWAWRCAQEPRRLGPRYGRALLWFPRAILCDLVQRK